MRAVGALAVRHPRVLDAHHRRMRIAAGLAGAASSASAVVVFILNRDLFFEIYPCEYSHKIQIQRSGSGNRIYVRKVCRKKIRLADLLFTNKPTFTSTCWIF